ncbi:FAD-dependent oxidoreductase [Parabacteroides sp. Marseille-P3160]|uniref:FAD-dependent oxidoreductase n=1 Tax=Parabacteroides sp. Marseille-P3160 TaxID=1917887 RepID=UPI00350E9125
MMAVAVATPSFAAANSSNGITAVEVRDTVSLKNKKIPVDNSWDVIVVGAGPGGCTAAIAAAREGAKTLLIEATGQLGGMGTAGILNAWCPFSDGEKIIYRGLAEKIFNESKKGVPHEPADKLNWVSINPEYLMSVYDKMVMESGAKVLFFSRLAAVEKSANDTVDAVIVANKSGLTAFKAKVYIDATGDGDLAAWAGASFKRGDDNGVVQSSTLCFAIGNIDQYRYGNGPAVQSSFRSKAGDLIESGKYPLFDNFLNDKLVGPGLLGMNAGHLVNVDATDPWALSEAMMTGRQKAAQFVAALAELYPDIFASAFLSKTGTILGVRDSRRIEGDYIFTVDDWMQRRTFEDEIGRNSYYLDVHKDGYKETRYKKGESHGIPYRCLTPKGLKNVLTAGRCISTDEEAFGSLRVMPPCLVTGEAAGMAAQHAIVQSKNDVHAVDIKYLRKRLKEEGQYFL